MAVTVDQSPLKTDELGLCTVGQVLAHLQRKNRLVVNVLIDGRSPDLERMGSLRQSPLNGHTVFIETADPSEMARGVLAAVGEQLLDADRLRTEAADLLQQNQNMRAMEKLAGCFSAWQNAQQSIEGVAQLMRMDLGTIVVDGRIIPDFLVDFAEQLRQIKSSLEARDFVMLSDILVYETTQAAAQWRAILAALAERIG
jgi:hypothetical protein